MKTKATPLADYIRPINMNGMEGRMLVLPAPKKRQREILLLYGSHASIERMQGIAEELNKYGSVTLPDFPGHGGMDSFYTIGEKPDIDTMADYLAAFIKMRFKRKRLSIFAMSFGFVVATRMLQRNPELAKKVDLVVSIVGFVHTDDFIFPQSKKALIRISSKVFSWRPTSAIIHHVIMRGPVIAGFYRLVADRHVKFSDADVAEREKRIKFEIKLWKINDMRTYMDNMHSMMTLDICDKQINLPVVHVAVEPDQYFNNTYVEQHLNVIYKEVTVVRNKMPAHAPTVIATAKDAAPYIPTKVRRMLTAK